jgi:hypothetical protein
MTKIKFNEPSRGSVSRNEAALTITNTNNTQNHSTLVVESRSSSGIYSHSRGGVGVEGDSDLGYGIAGHIYYGSAIVAYNDSAQANRLAISVSHWGGLAGAFNGHVIVSGLLTKAGGGFQIDHPGDPANKYLNHAFVESSDMKNVYDGIAILDANGEAIVDLPEWFEVLNKEFRYQLTAMGAPGQNLYIANEISHNRFRIAGGAKIMKVSWQVTGIRKDPWAAKHSLLVEQENKDSGRGYYLHPELHNPSEEKGLMRLRYPHMKRAMKERRKKVQ